MSLVLPFPSLSCIPLLHCRISSSYCKVHEARNSWVPYVWQGFSEMLRVQQQYKTNNVDIWSRRTRTRCWKAGRFELGLQCTHTGASKRVCARCVCFRYVSTSQIPLGRRSRTYTNTRSDWTYVCVANYFAISQICSAEWSRCIASWPLGKKRRIELRA